MPKVRSHAFIAVILLLVNGIPDINAQPSVASSLVNHSSPFPTASTCPAGTVNYITQTLPQQCFKTAWTEGNASKSSTGKSAQSTSNEQTAETVGSNIGFEEHGATTATEPAEASDASTTTSVVEASSGSDQLSSLSGDSISPSAIAWETPSLTLEAELGSDSDSPLDNALFLSFEDWKKQNLAKAGQSADIIGHGRTQSGDPEPRRRPGSINIALDSLGEDTEIELDFSGFVNPVTASDALVSGKTESGADIQEPDTKNNAEKQDAGFQGATQRSKDAGTTCKERSNYASFDCAATVLKTNPECTGATSVLVENKDSYMLNECSAKNKFLIVELCDDILVDTVVLANFEFFSSTFRSFKVSVSDRYPVKMDRWKELGTFVARNSREVQAFAIENPLIWARYLRIEFLTHFGNEYYCPISLLRVHGTTMIEEFRHQEETISGEDDVDEQTQVEGAGDEGAAAGDIKQGQSPPSTEQPSDTKDSMGDFSDNPTPAAESINIPLESEEESPTSTFTPVNSSWNQLHVIFDIVNQQDPVCYPEEYKAEMSALPNAPAVANAAKEVVQETAVIIASEGAPSATIVPPHSSTQTATVPTTSTFLLSSSDNAEMKHKFSTPQSTDPSSKPQPNETATVYIKPSASHTQPTTANPTTQESFFKSIHKRLQLLESNSTLSLQYIEEQSRILRDAFHKVEKRQLAKTTNFLETLNATVLSELRDFRHQYDQIWQSTVLELSSHREQSQREVVALSARLSLLADEILFQKRMAILQFTLILLCLVLVIFSRSTSAAGMSYVELPPLVQNTAHKSPPHKTTYSTFETPPTSPSSTAPNSRYGTSRRAAGHGRHASADSKSTTRSPSDHRSESPAIAQSPPTPTSEPEPGSDADESGGHRSSSPPLSDGPEANVLPRESRSGPATPSGTMMALGALEFVVRDEEGDEDVSVTGPFEDFSEEGKRGE
ncbi:MAG: sad1 unc domain [Lasallia pustulata]|uniref:Sad1 unc domain n=1 Tax=Lasallia pustulata TaxID=136370 RepID=A0A5M8PQS3_9LECA|nr:MAG: sad1 unc domain [Lasallia pustulata]